MRRRPEMEIPAEMLLLVGEGSPSIEEKSRMLQHIRAFSPEMSQELDRFLMDNLERRGLGLLEARAHQEKLESLLDKLSAEPWHPAVVVRRAVMTARGPLVMVMSGSARRLVGVADGIDINALNVGDEVFLSSHLNVILEKSSYGIPRCGQIASFERMTEDRRLVLQSRDEEFVVEVCEAFDPSTLERGDLVRWDSAMQMAFERMERGEGKQFILQEVVNVPRDRVGGQDQAIETLISSLATILVEPQKAAAYGLDERLPTILMVGPPGVGKTLMARVAASEIQRLYHKRCRFGVVKPGEWEDPFVGVTQKNIRNSFQALRDASHDGFGVMFLDEVESVGRLRGSAVGHHSDKFLDALLIELDGFANQSDVAIIAATNRVDLLDPALLDRFSVQIKVSRPDLRAARAIFGIHLPATRPYSPNGTSAGDTRQAMIETAVSRLYSPNGENALCVLRFRDGKTRTVTAKELASGRLFEQICRAASQRAFLRDVRGGDNGLRVEDMEEAVSDAIERLATTLTIRNVSNYLSDLPQDVDVVSVEPVRRKVSRPYRYLNVAGHRTEEMPT